MAFRNHVRGNGGYENVVINRSFPVRFGASMRSHGFDLLDLRAVRGTTISRQQVERRAREAAAPRRSRAALPARPQLRPRGVCEAVEAIGFSGGGLTPDAREPIVAAPRALPIGRRVERHDQAVLGRWLERRLERDRPRAACRRTSARARDGRSRIHDARPRRARRRDGTVRLEHRVSFDHGSLCSCRPHVDHKYRGRHTRVFTSTSLVPPVAPRRMISTSG